MDDGGPDPIAEWEAASDRVSALVTSLSSDQVGTRVPACPDWTVRDLLSHMVGLGADVLAGDEPDDHNPGWTAAQVDARRDRSVADLVAEWHALAPDLVAWMRAHGARPLNDVVIHEQDLRGAVGVPGGRDGGGFAIVRDTMAGRFGDRVADLPPVALIGEGWSWCSSGAPADAAVELRAPDFDLGRALVTRRTADQLRSWTTRGDVTPYLAAFAALGPLPDRPLPE